MRGQRTVIIGGGTAGCILAARIARQGSPVHLLEKGMRPSAFSSSSVKMPMHRTLLRNENPKNEGPSNLSTVHSTVPQKGCGSRRLPYRVGNILGGRSAASGELSFIRPALEELTGWFPRISSLGDCERVFEAFGAESHRRDEDIPCIAYEEERFLSPFTAAFMRSSTAEDFETSSAGHLDRSSKGIACVPKKRIHPQTASVISTYSEYLVPTENHKFFGQLLHVQCNTTVNSIEFNDNNAVKSVVYTDSENCTHHLPCDRAILCAGALETPRILLASGIGSPQWLDLFGVQCKIPLSEVGKNLYDQAELQLPFPTMNSMSSTSMFHPVVRMLIELEWSLLGRGWGGNSFEGPRIYGNSSEGDAAEHFPDYGMFLRPYILPQGKNIQHGFTLDVRLLRPRSRGELVFQHSEDKKGQVEVKVDPNYFANRSDVSTLTRAAKSAQALCSQKPLRDMQKCPPEIDSSSESISKHAVGCGEFGGTCALGTVLNSALQVENTRNCYVCDASAIPHPISAGLSSTVMLMAHSLADHLSGE
ncbi:glucose-methanol-choline oxidoreductase [Perkinsela sp. CCAP 1560/4]|nr:glucose-methanol-choline oxidoreductase [Perkinsela sp. CCAP 1560/4]|eukprot:KNH07288.1 glucose-methanol-choline oxidoreductase [Perkinsela sp. CCAP 1560/4]